MAAEMKAPRKMSPINATVLLAMTDCKQETDESAQPDYVIQAGEIII